MIKKLTNLCVKEIVDTTASDTETQWITIPHGDDQFKLLVYTDEVFNVITIDTFAKFHHCYVKKQGKAISNYHCLISAIIYFLVLDWDGVEDVNGAPEEYDHDKLILLLKRNPDIFKTLFLKLIEIDDQIQENKKGEQ